MEFVRPTSPLRCAHTLIWLISRGRKPIARTGSRNSSGPGANIIPGTARERALMPSPCRRGRSGVSAGRTATLRVRLNPPSRLALRPSDALAGSWKTQTPLPSGHQRGSWPGSSSGIGTSWTSILERFLGRVHPQHGSRNPVGTWLLLRTR
jgi:hypothetical protein